MINKTEWNRMMEGKLYNPYKVGDNSFKNVHAAQKSLMNQNTGTIKVLLKN